jgi:hypothetical protein
MQDEQEAGHGYRPYCRTEDTEQIDLFLVGVDE